MVEVQVGVDDPLHSSWAMADLGDAASSWVRPAGPGLLIP
jgi:hypothetical protein